MSCFDVKIHDPTDNCLCDFDISITSVDPLVEIEIEDKEEAVDVGINTIHLDIDCQISDLSPVIQCAIFDATEYVTININIDCSVNENQILQFEYDLLTWGLEDVEETKYNILTSTSYWQLEEIEELL